MKNKTTIVVFSAFMVAVLLTKFLYENPCSVPKCRSISISHKSLSRKPADPPFDFVPAAFNNFCDCDKLFGNDTAAAGYKMSSEFSEKFPAFTAEVRKFTVNNFGHTGSMLPMYKAIHYLASRPNVYNVCETGFNIGYSSFNYLTANSHSVVHSFDLGLGRSTKIMASYLSQHYPKRLFVHYGNSIRVVPKFVRTHPDHRCDFILVDGGHYYKAAMADLRNMAAMANVDSGNILVLDDYPSVKYQETGWAWENMRRWGYVSELMRCYFPNHKIFPNAGFVIGTVIRRPLLSTK